jgi:hypothetical protein
MKRLFAHLVIALFTLPILALPPSCPVVPTLVVDDYVIEGTAIDGETLLRFAQVSLYSKGKLGAAPQRMKTGVLHSTTCRRAFIGSRFSA